MNIGLIFRWGSTILGMVQDPNIHMICRGAWTGIKKLRTTMDPSPGPRPSSGAPATPGVKQLPAGSNTPLSPEVPEIRQFPGGPGMGRMPSESEMRRLLQDPKVKRMLKDPKMRRILQDPTMWPTPGTRSAKRMPELYSSPRTPGFSEYERQDGQFPFAWMQQPAKSSAKKQMRRIPKKK